MLVNPGQKAVSPALRPALAHRAGQLTQQWDSARLRMTRQLELIGLAELRTEAERRWEKAFTETFARYEERWGAPHPVPRATALGLLPA
ncbi:hypothetical protein GCM10020295_16140 [Streptomyces cinereospinus]